MVRKEKKSIGIIFGGNSNEHNVSISSAKTVFKSLNPSLVSLVKKIFSNPNIGKLEFSWSSSKNSDLVFRYRDWYKSKSDWLLNTEPSSAIYDLILLLFSKTSRKS